MVKCFDYLYNSSPNGEIGITPRHLAILYHSLCKTRNRNTDDYGAEKVMQSGEKVEEFWRKYGFSPALIRTKTSAEMQILHSQLMTVE